MIALIFSIICSAALGFVFKMFSRFGVNVLHAVVTNYWTAVAVAGLSLGAFPLSAENAQIDGFYWATVVGATFIGGFVAIGMGTQKIGLATTIILQKMSLIAPVLLGIFYFSEQATAWKWLGIGAAIASIFLTTNTDSEHSKGFSFNLPMLGWVIFIMAIFADLGVLLMNKWYPSAATNPRIIATLFGTAGAVGLVTILVSILGGGEKPHWKSIVGGILLGIPNYGSIFFLLKSMENGIPSSTVFPTANVGVIIAATILAVIFFRERVTVRNAIGIGLAILAIILVSF